MLREARSEKPVGTALAVNGK